MSNYPPANPGPGPRNGGDYWSSRPPWYVAMVGGGILIILVIVLAILLRDDGNEIQTVAPTLTSQAPTSTSGDAAQTTTTGSSSTSAASTSTTDGSTTTSTSTTTTVPTSTIVSTTTTVGTTTTTEGPAAYASAMWPWFDSSQRYDDPVEAARGFAVDYIGFSEPIVGPFQQGDTRSGEVEIKPAGDGPITTVLVRQLGAANTWWVLGAVTEHTIIDTPDALAVIDSPLRVTGDALAFEGVVEFELRGDGATTPLTTGIVTGGGGEMMPFEGEFAWTNPGQGSGAVVLITRGMDDDRVWTVAAVRVAFAAG